MIFAGAILLPKCVIEFGSKRQFAKEIAEGIFVEHDFCHGDTETRSFIFLCVSVTLWQSFLVHLLDLPMQARTDGSLTDLSPLHARRA